MVKEQVLKKISPAKIMIFKIRNRKGYAGICMDNLTEGATKLQVVERMEKALKRMGYSFK